jgi:hypothetical protein
MNVSFFRKLRWLTRRSEKEAELREELQFHLEEERNSAGKTELRRMRPDGPRAASWATTL